MNTYLKKRSSSRKLSHPLNATRNFNISCVSYIFLSCLHSARFCNFKLPINARKHGHKRANVHKRGLLIAVTCDYFSTWIYIVFRAKDTFSP